MKKGMIIFCLTVYIFASLFVLPARRAEAALPAAIAAGAAGVEIGVGAYVLAGIALASIAGTVVGVEYGDEIRKHAQTVWKNANQAVKDSMKASIAAAVQAGSNVIKISKDVADYIKDAFNRLYPLLVAPDKVNNSVTVETDNKGFSLIAADGYDFVARVDFGRNAGEYVRGNELEWDGYEYYSYGYPVELFPYGVIAYAPYYVSYVYDYPRAMSELAKVGVYPFQIPESEVLPNKDVIDHEVDRVVSGAMSSGVYVPDDIKAYPVDNAGNRVSDQPLAWNNNTKVWERAEGGTWTGAIDWDFPMPKVGADGKVVVGDTVAVGEGVGTKVGTGEDVGVGEGLLQDILTGVRTIADTLTTGLVGDTSKINWDKLKMAGTAFTTSFPFSIPWDIGRALDAAFGSFDELKNTPEWEWKINFLGQQYPIRFKIDDYFLSWFGIIRSVMLILFDVGLVYAVRKMLGGAS